MTEFVTAACIRCLEVGLFAPAACRVPVKHVNGAGVTFIVIKSVAINSGGRTVFCGCRNGEGVARDCYRPAEAIAGIRV